MELLMITAIEEFEKDIQKMLFKTGVKSYSYSPVRGVKNTSTESISENWFSSGSVEIDSLVFWVLVEIENTNLLYDKIESFNQKQESASKIHISTIGISKHNM